MNTRGIPQVKINLNKEDQWGPDKENRRRKLMHGTT